MTVQVQELWRYPVKSMRGEPLVSAYVGIDGIDGDRMVHVRQQDGRVITSRFRPGLLGLTATIGGDGEPLIDGAPWDSPEALARVRRASAPGAELVRFDGSDRGQRYDVLPLTVLTDGMVKAVGVDQRRFRANIVIDGVADLAEAGWPGYGLQIGDALIGVRNRRARCVMTTFDPDTLEQDVDVLRRVVREFDGRVALDCWVETPGVVAVGDPVHLVELAPDVSPPRGNGSDAHRWARGLLPMCE